MRCGFARILILFLISITISRIPVFAQCGTKISSFPYNQDFETSNGSWVTGGTNSDWAWGTPNKAVINAAGSGTKCWITGGLNGPGYNDREESWLRSPCFDFSNLPYPYVSFLVFWETEQKFDGANLQYSTNNGNTWVDAGGVNDAVNCLNDNWFNSGNINNIIQGWAGNIQPNSGQCLGGAGKGRWVSAKHTFPNLGGRSSVIFRFQFGAGSTCNNYDGFAFDKFTIENAPPNNAGFTYNCTNSNTVSFANTSTNCPTSYQWNFGDPSSANNISTQKDPVHTFYAPGSYTVTLTASGPGNAPSTISQTINILKVTTTLVSALACYGNNDGSIIATTTGGPGVYNYTWNTTPVQTGQTISGLVAGAYTVNVTSANSCPASATHVLAQPAAMSHSVTAVASKCGLANGSATITENGGTGSYTYQWSPYGGTAANASGLKAGDYVVTVFDQLVCKDLVDVHIDNTNGNLEAIISAKTDVSCFGASTGSASVTATGSAGPFTYEWSPSGGNAATANNLKAGNYSVVVKDQNGCSSAAAVAILQPASIIEVGINIKFASCGLDNGAAEVIVKGGVPPYSYSWAPGNYTSDSIGGLATGKYQVIVKDAAGCESNIEFTIGRDPIIEIASIQHTDVTCFSANNGTASATATGGSNAEPYVFTWTNGTNTFSGDAINNLPAGNYQLTVKDNDDCAVTGNVIIGQPQKITHTVTITNETCNNANGTAQLRVAGGTAPYTYSWSPTGGTNSSASGLKAGDYKVTITDSHQCTDEAVIQIINTGSNLTLNTTTTGVNCFGGTNGAATVNVLNNSGPFTYTWSSSASTTAIAGNLAAGTYIVKVQDINGCTGVAPATVTQPAAALTATVTNSAASCGLNNGTASVMATGGTGPYTHKWMPGNFTSANITDLAAGKYVLTITDANGCEKTMETVIDPSSSFAISSISHVDVLCNGAQTGSANAIVSGGTSPLTYTWVNGTNTFAGNSITNVEAGTYNLDVKDAAGCSTDTSVTIKEPAKMLLNVVTTPASCGIANGTATITPSGGVAPYGFKWAHNGVRTATISGPAGDYIAYVVDANQCTDTVHVHIAQAGNLSVAAGNISHVNCFGDSTGSATIIASGNNGPFTFNWSPLGGSGASATRLPAGNYEVMVSDRNGCKQTKTVQINQPVTSLKTTITHASTTCGDNNGTTSIIVSGGTPSYTYLWMQGNTTAAEIQNLKAGNYKVSVKDSKGCLAMDSVQIEPSSKPLIENINATNVLCFGGQTGTATAIVSGGKVPYNYKWTAGTREYTGNILTNLPKGSYQLNVTDDAGCITSGSINILEPEALSLTVATKPTTCGGNNGTATAIATGGTPAYSYVWSTGSTQAFADNLPGGVHDVLVKDANGCSTSNNNINIQRSSPLRVSLGNDTSICPGGKVVLTPGNYTSYTWQNNSHDPTFTATSAALYSVTVTDSIGCSAFDQMKVEINCRDIVFPSAFTPNSDGHNDLFGPLGTLGAVSNYKLTIYNRWGQAIFTSVNPFEKWNGKFKGINPGTGTYIWVAEYSFNGDTQKVQKGTLTLIY